MSRPVGVPVVTGAPTGAGGVVGAGAAGAGATGGRDAAGEGAGVGTGAAWWRHAHRVLRIADPAIQTIEASRGSTGGMSSRDQQPVPLTHKLLATPSVPVVAGQWSHGFGDFSDL